MSQHRSGHSILIGWIAQKSLSVCRAKTTVRRSTILSGKLRYRAMCKICLANLRWCASSTIDCRPKISSAICLLNALDPVVNRWHGVRQPRAQASRELLGELLCRVIRHFALLEDRANQPQSTLSVNRAVCIVGLLGESGCRIIGQLDILRLPGSWAICIVR